MRLCILSFEPFVSSSQQTRVSNVLRLVRTAKVTYLYTLPFAAYVAAWRGCVVTDLVVDSRTSAGPLFEEGREVPSSARDGRSVARGGGGYCPWIGDLEG